MPHIAREVLAGERGPGGDDVGRRAREDDRTAAAAGAVEPSSQPSSCSVSARWDPVVDSSRT
jgi:hypothetical protein